MLLAVELDFFAGVFAEQHEVAHALTDFANGSIGGLATRTDGDDFGFEGLFFGRIRDNETASGLFLGSHSFDEDTIVQGTKFHGVSPGWLG